MLQPVRKGARVLESMHCLGSNEGTATRTYHGLSIRGSVPKPFSATSLGPLYVPAGSGIRTAALRLPTASMPVTATLQVTLHVWNKQYAMKEWKLSPTATLLDVSAELQSVVNKPAWVSGSYIGIRLADDTGAQQTMDLDLVMTYTAPGSTTPATSKSWLCQQLKCDATSKPYNCVQVTTDRCTAVISDHVNMSWSRRALTAGFVVHTNTGMVGALALYNSSQTITDGMQCTSTPKLEWPGGVVQAPQRLETGACYPDVGVSLWSHKPAANTTLPPPQATPSTDSTVLLASVAPYILPEKKGRLELVRANRTHPVAISTLSPSTATIIPPTSIRMSGAVWVTQKQYPGGTVALLASVKASKPGAYIVYAYMGTHVEQNGPSPTTSETPAGLASADSISAMNFCGTSDGRSQNADAMSTADGFAWCAQTTVFIETVGDFRVLLTTTLADAAVGAVAFVALHTNWDLNGLAPALDRAASLVPPRTSMLSDSCSCSTDGTSGGVDVDFKGCGSIAKEEDTANSASQSWCYLKGGLAAGCTCATASSKYPGAAYRPCRAAPLCRQVEASKYDLLAKVTAAPTRGLYTHASGKAVLDDQCGPHIVYTGPAGSHATLVYFGAEDPGSADTADTAKQWKVYANADVDAVAVSTVAASQARLATMLVECVCQRVRAAKHSTKYNGGLTATIRLTVSDIGPAAPARTTVPKGNPTASSLVALVFIRSLARPDGVIKHAVYADDVGTDRAVATDISVPVDMMTHTGSVEAVVVLVDGQCHVVPAAYTETMVYDWLFRTATTEASITTIQIAPSSLPSWNRPVILDVKRRVGNEAVVTWLGRKDATTPGSLILKTTDKTAAEVQGTLVPMDDSEYVRSVPAVRNVHHSLARGVNGADRYTLAIEQGSDDSTTTSVRVLPAIPATSSVGVPTNLVVTFDDIDKTLTAQWAPASISAIPALGYVLEVSGGAGSDLSRKIIDAGNVLQASFPPVASNGGLHVIRVRAFVRGAGICAISKLKCIGPPLGGEKLLGAFSDKVEVDVPTTTPSPIGVGVSNITGSSFKVMWQESAYAATATNEPIVYRVFVEHAQAAALAARPVKCVADITADANPSFILKTTSTNAFITNVLPASKYYISLSASTSKHESHRSKAIVVNTLSSGKPHLPEKVQMKLLSGTCNGLPDPIMCSMIEKNACRFSSTALKEVDIKKTCPSLCSTCSVPKAYGYHMAVLRWLPACTETKRNQSFDILVSPFKAGAGLDSIGNTNCGADGSKCSSLQVNRSRTATSCNGYTDPDFCASLGQHCNNTNFKNELNIQIGVHLDDICTNVCGTCGPTSMFVATTNVYGAGDFIVGVRSVDSETVGDYVQKFVSIEDPSASSSTATEESSFQTAVLISIACLAFVAMLLLSAGFITRGKKEEEEVVHSDLETQLDQMKSGIEGLGGKVQGMFKDEFARTIGDAEASEAEFTALEIKRHQLDLGDVLGKGAFGVVCRGHLEGINAGGEHLTKDEVAVKTLLEGAASEELTKFLMEARLMSLLRHKNLLNILAVVTGDQPFYIVTELMINGDLKDYLRLCRPELAEGPKHVLESSDLMTMVFQISGALRFLEFRHVIHRDLAARNVLVGENNLVKLADFGMSRNVYESDYYKKTSDDRVPVKWMAPESVSDRIYTNLSDVWSFGILMWEILAFGVAPYAEYTAMESVAAIAAGYRMKRPDYCPEDVYDELIMKCWQYQPDDRPDFARCYDILRELLGEEGEELPVDPTLPIEQQALLRDGDGYLDVNVDGATAAAGEFAANQFTEGNVMNGVDFDFQEGDDMGNAPPMALSATQAPPGRSPPPGWQPGA